MHYIAKVRIEGFQSHADTTIELVNGLNAITGPSDNGKSAVLRAIRWCLWNQAPEGEWIRKGCTRAAVTTTYSDEVEITRERDKKRNRYLVKVPGQETLELVDFGVNVPAEIIRAHGMYPIPFNAKHPSLLNFATQLEAPFFLTESAPERARILGKLAGVEVIDRAVSDANVDIKAGSRTVKEREAEVARLDEDLVGYADLADQEQRVGEAEQLLQAARQTEGRLDKLKSLSMRSSDLQRRMSAAQSVIDHNRQVVGALPLLQQALSAHQAHSALNTLRDRQERVMNAMDAASETVRRLAAVPEAVTLIAHAQETEALLQTLRRLAQTRDKVKREWGPTKQRIRQTTGAPEAVKLLAEVQATGETLARLIPLRGKMQRIRTDYGKARQQVAQERERAKAAQALEEAVQADTRLRELLKLRERRIAMNGKVVVQEGRVLAATQRRAQAQTHFAKALENAGVCPTCGQAVSAHISASIAAGMMHEEAHHHG